MRSRSNAALFWPILLVITVVDVITKAMAERMLLPRGIPHEVLGNTVRLTLVYNPGAAFGLNLGPHSRWIFTVLTIVALVILGRLYRSTQPGDVARVTALGLVCAGAIGNLIDRVRSMFGVVDFIDIGIGNARWPTFNVADMAVSVGAAMLAWVLWQEDRAAQAAGAGSPAVVPAAASGGEPGDLVCRARRRSSAEAHDCSGVPRRPSSRSTSSRSSSRNSSSRRATYRIASSATSCASRSRTIRARRSACRSARTPGTSSGRSR